MTLNELREKCISNRNHSYDVRGGTCYSRNGKVAYVENGSNGEIAVYYERVHVADMWPEHFGAPDTIVRFFRFPVVEQLAKLYKVTHVEDYH